MAQAELENMRSAYIAWLRAAISVLGRDKDGNFKCTEFGRLVINSGRGELEGGARAAWAKKKIPGSTVHGWLGGRVPYDEMTLPGPTTSAGTEDIVLPKGFVREALARTVQELAPVPPPEARQWLSFQDLADRYEVVQHQKPVEAGRRGTDRRKDLAKRHRAGELETWLFGSCGQQPADIDPLVLGLGSWVTEGMLPPYVQRDADRALRAALDDPARRLVVLVGPPKSGKTRSLIEALRAVRPTCRIWWSLAHPKAIEVVTSRASTDPSPPSLVVVLDDLQRYSLGVPGGLTANVLNRLLETGVTVAATLHAATLAELRLRTFFHGPVPLSTERPEAAGDSALADLLTTSSIVFGSVLTEAELLAVPESLRAAAGEHGLEQASLARLAELLSAKDQLVALCEHAKHDYEHPYRWAVVLAALDANVLYPAGATAGQLSQLTRWAHGRVAPSRTWVQAKFDDALEWATTPIGGHGSPHSAVQLTAEGLYAIFDALVPSLQLGRWSSEHLWPWRDELPDDALFQAAVADKAARDEQAGRVEISEQRARQELEEGRWLQAAAERGHPEAMFELGELLMWAGSAEGTVWVERSAWAGNVDAMRSLGLIRQGEQRTDDDDTDGAVAWWDKAIDLGDELALESLAQLREAQGRAREAFDLWVRGTTVGEGHHRAHCMYMVGDYRHQQGRLSDEDPDGAVAWWKKAAEANPASARPAMRLAELRYDQGRVYPAGPDDLGDRDCAAGWWERAARATEGAQPRRAAMMRLGELRDAEGRVGDDDPEGAAAWWKTAAELAPWTYSPAMLRLGWLRYEHGRIADDDGDGAVYWWKRATDPASLGAGYAGEAAIYWLGWLRYNQGRTDPDDPDGAPAWWRRLFEGRGPDDQGRPSDQVLRVMPSLWRGVAHIRTGPPLGTKRPPSA